MSFEADRAIIHIQDLERKYQKLLDSSQAEYVKKLEGDIKVLEEQWKSQIEINHALKMRIADLGQQLGRKLNEDEKANSQSNNPANHY